MKVADEIAFKVPISIEYQKRSLLCSRLQQIHCKLFTRWSQNWSFVVRTGKRSVYEYSSHVFWSRTPSRMSVPFPLRSHLQLCVCYKKTHSAAPKRYEKMLRRSLLRFRTNVYSIFIKAARLWIFGLETIFLIFLKLYLF